MAGEKWQFLSGVPALLLVPESRQELCLTLPGHQLCADKKPAAAQWEPALFLVGEASPTVRFFPL